MSLDEQVEQEQLRKDAARYRFLRKYIANNEHDFPIHEDPVSPEHADALIDAAIIAQKSN